MTPHLPNAALGLAFIAFSILTYRTGRLGRSGTIFTREQYPVIYWGVVVLAAVAGTVVLTYAIAKATHRFRRFTDWIDRAAARCFVVLGRKGAER